MVHDETVDNDPTAAAADSHYPIHIHFAADVVLPDSHGAAHVVKEVSPVVHGPCNALYAAKALRDLQTCRGLLLQRSDIHEDDRRG